MVVKKFIDNTKYYFSKILENSTKIKNCINKVKNSTFGKEERKEETL